jgi:putative ABC transport system permease protein
VRLWELIKLAMGGIRRTPLRVLLTALGVTIATGSLVTMVGFALGVQARVEEPFQKSELLNRIDVSTKRGPGRPSSNKPDANANSSESGKPPVSLDTAALEQIAALPGVALAYPELRLSSVEVIRGDDIQTTSATGLPREAGGLPFIKETLFAGRFFDSHGFNEVILGKALVKAFGFDSPAEILGEKLIIKARGLAPEEGRTFKFKQVQIEVEVVGVWDPPGGRPSFSRDGILLPQDVIQMLPGVGLDSSLEWLRFGKTSQGYDRAVVRVHRPTDLFKVEQQIKDMGFQTRTLFAQIKDIRKGFLIMDAVLGAVGTVALVVAGLGIINTLLMAVLERYREIGTYKALGASNGDVRVIFLTEAGLVGLVGGLGGLALARLVSWLMEMAVNAYARSQGIDDPVMAFAFPFYLLAGAVLFALAVSLISGVYPATRAARVDPIQALRGE